MYILHEMQTTGAETALVPAVTKANYNEAESAFHVAAAAAAISTVPVHTIVLMDEHGNVKRRECYEHQAEGQEV